MITGHTKLLAVIGNPVAHSLSPQIHNAFAEATGADVAYMAFEVTRATLPGFIAAAKTLQMAGFNVTMPLKEAIVPHLDALDDTARSCGAVNTVTLCGGALTGHNTDGEGLVLSLRDALPDLRGRHALVLGAGGAAKAVTAALAGAGADVAVLSRRGAAELPWGAVAERAAAADLIVNATPLGMTGNPDFGDFAFLDAAPRSAVVYDLVYNPRVTQLLTAARARGLTTLGGADLLVWQAAAAFRHFTGARVDDDIETRGRA